MSEPIVFINVGTRCDSYVNIHEIAAVVPNSFDERNTTIILKSGDKIVTDRPIYEINAMIAKVVQP